MLDISTQFHESCKFRWKIPHLIEILQLIWWQWGRFFDKLSGKWGLVFSPSAVSTVWPCQQQSANWVLMITLDTGHILLAATGDDAGKLNTSTVLPLRAFILRALCAWSPPPATVVTPTGESARDIIVFQWVVAIASWPLVHCLNKAHSCFKQRMTSKSPRAWIELKKLTVENRHWHWYPCLLVHWCCHSLFIENSSKQNFNISRKLPNCWANSGLEQATKLILHIATYFQRNNYPGLTVGMYSIGEKFCSDLTAENSENSGSLTPPPFYCLIRLHSMAAANSLFSLSTALQTGTGSQWLFWIHYCC